MDQKGKPGQSHTGVSEDWNASRLRGTTTYEWPPLAEIHAAAFRLSVVQCVGISGSCGKELVHMGFL